MQVKLITREDTVTRKMHLCPRVDEIVELNDVDYIAQKIVHPTDGFPKVFLMSPVDHILERSPRGIQKVADYLLGEVFDHPDIPEDLHDPGVPADNFLEWHRKWGQAYYRQWVRNRAEAVVDDWQEGDDLYEQIEYHTCGNFPPHYLIRKFTDTDYQDIVQMVEGDILYRLPDDIKEAS